MRDRVVIRCECSLTVSMTDLIRPLNIRQHWIKLQWVPGIYVRVVDVRWLGDTASPRVMPAFPHESARWYACVAASAGAVVSEIPALLTVPLLLETAPDSCPTTAQANTHVDHRSGVGAWLRVHTALLQVLPRVLRHSTTRRACGFQHHATSGNDTAATSAGAVTVVRPVVGARPSSQRINFCQRSGIKLYRDGL